MIAEGSPNSPANRRHASARRTATRSWSPRAGLAVSAQRLDRQRPFAYSRRMAKRDSLARYAQGRARAMVEIEKIDEVRHYEHRSRLT